MPYRFTLTLLAASCAVTASAAVYQWRDANGNVYYSDKPPPASVQSRERVIKPNVISDASKPAPPAAVEKRVTLYLTPNCEDCQVARTLLVANGIAFTEVEIMADPKVAQALFAKISRPGQPLPPPPFLEINGQVLRSWDQFTWTSVLKQSGYSIKEQQ
ncbi:DUF4124 domain-containing protein [Chitinibacteraceae bacterium HSL-7]